MTLAETLFSIGLVAGVAIGFLAWKYNWKIAEYL